MSAYVKNTGAAGRTTERVYHGEEARRVAMNRLGGHPICIGCGGEVDTWQLASSRSRPDPQCSKCFDRMLSDWTSSTKAYKREKREMERNGWKEDRRRRARGR